MQIAHHHTPNKGPARCSRVLDPPLAFTYRENNDNFNFNAISDDKVYIDC